MSGISKTIELPVPPMTDLKASRISAGAPVALFMSNGQKLEGGLAAFDNKERCIRFTRKNSRVNIDFSMDEIKAMQLVEPLPWHPDYTLNKNTAAVMPPPPCQTFSITFKDQSTLEGETYGSRSDNQGLHLFKQCNQDHYLHIFVPHSAIEKKVLGEQLGDILVRESKVTKEQVEEAVAEQNQAREKPLGDYLIGHKVVNATQLEEALQRQKSMPQMRLGEILISENLINDTQLDEALHAQKGERKKPLGEILVDKGLVAKGQIQQALAKKVGIPFVHIEEFQILPSTIDMLPVELVTEHKVIPLYEFSDKLAVAMENPLNFEALDALRFHTNKYIEPVMATEADVDSAIQMYYTSNTNVLDSLGDHSHHSDLNYFEETEERVDEKLADNIVVKLINKIVMDAHQQGVSDIHIEPSPGKSKTLVRFRKDGTMIRYHEFPAQYRNSLISRIKVMAKLDISERRKPQDGKIAFKQFGPSDIELRVATLPTAGEVEDVVMRILANSEALPINKLGLSTRNLDTILEAIAKPYGLFLVCGPTGSGKTTSLHSVLGHLNNSERKIWTAEDPVEITQPGLRQLQVNPKINLTFASAMRAFLRADPDIIMVGEMRDQETTTMGIEASLTGHLVFSTLHTNTAVESITRLLDMGMDPFNFADALLGIVAQRLAKSLCSNCKQEYHPSEEEMQHMAFDYCKELMPADASDESKIEFVKNQLNEWKQRWGNKEGQLTLYRPVGCELCSDTGYRGRIGLHEVLAPSEKVKHLIREKSTTAKIQSIALTEGFRTLKQDGIEKVLQGQTDYPQVRRVCIK